MNSKYQQWNSEGLFCPYGCEAAVGNKIKEENFEYVLSTDSGPVVYSVKIKIPVRICEMCDAEWTDSAAADIRRAAVVADRIDREIIRKIKNNS